MSELHSEPVPVSITSAADRPTVHPAPLRSSRPAPPRRRFDLTADDLAALLPGEAGYRTRQVWQGLVEQGLEPEEITTVSKTLRERLRTEPSLLRSLALDTESVSEDGDTIKWLWTLHDGSQIETVLMHYADRSTVCISSQAGCAMGCGFCATGQGGFERHLTAGEIVEQVVVARRRASLDGRRLSNVVYMGMGEPMANFGPVWTSVCRIHDDLGLSARHLTISTVGIVPGIRRLAAEELPVNLAVSLHAADDTKRDRLVPINRTYPLAELADACADYLSAKGRRLSFEWACIRDENDTPGDARQLAAYALPLGAHVNLIPLNPTPGSLAIGTGANGVRAFRDDLVALGVNATIRRNRGTGIDAACGQLAARARR